MNKPGKRIKDIIRILHQTYPNSRTALRFRTPLQILIATILSAQCTDKKVNEITPALFKKYSGTADFAVADRVELENEIRPTGFYRNKAKNIIKTCQKIKEDFQGEVPDNIAALITLPGVARKTANIVLSSGFNRAEGIAVDTHVKRISEKVPDKIERDLMKVVPKKDWLDFNYLLVNHGRTFCSARKPHCKECPIRHLCLYHLSPPSVTIK